MSAWTLHWLAENQFRLPLELTPLGCASLTAAGDRLATDIAALEQLEAPATDTQILKTLETLAEVFQVSIPDTAGLEIYVAALQQIPRLAFVEACDRLVLSHKWPRLPYPADFIEAATCATDQLRTLKMVLLHEQGKCRRALEMLQ